eukprot:CAMPEP_0174738068 /NCGR_PEP_ID=MMETSP1094-20130205/69309_1 /TAXON_ID=156173 /ORGANISM="Chrysochromulina brevifilum, Strain UTEX LB 985" /LENGTH=82 /DNA_ID=CAMNT_0015941411 /DNA_START=200 /DNA_END=449 /DNA_ORIENTATION=+
MTASRALLNHVANALMWNGLSYARAARAAFRDLCLSLDVLRYPTAWYQAGPYGELLRPFANDLGVPLGVRFGVRLAGRLSAR